MEFAIVAPLFFALIFGMIVFGRAIMVKQVVTNASREGARLAVLPGSTGQMVNDRVKEILGAALGEDIPDLATIEILDMNGNPLNPEAAQYNDLIQVKVSLPWGNRSVGWVILPESSASPWSWTQGISEKDLSATTVMRTERVQ